MIQECKFNPASDVEQVVPELAVDVSEVMESHMVVSTGDTTPYSKETEVGEVGHYITDKITGAMVALRLGKSMAAASQASEGLQSTPEE